MTMHTDRAVHKALDLHGLVQAIRKEANLSQSEVAARLGIAPGSYSEFERNLLQGSVSRFLKLLKALDVELILRTMPSTVEPDKGIADTDQDPRKRR